ncbi:tRNA (N6-isopentenyl adenosine(37)-C2)-methylthiotransferase MiaB [Candidatus Aerophobetes bacterium Ae_b3a]|nr:MAG: tRNA (N6-isopentenyl adenosine(37)-C2)-methylthiotransferase MiaB [Candidatus Aerophobetes bacterium Ae_b3a]
MESNSLKVYIRTYGCQMNEYDSEIMAGLLENSGYHLTDNPAEAGVILLNTCYVREKVKHKIYSRLGELKKLKEEKPELILGLCGCLVQKEPEEVLRRAPYLDFILGTSNFYQLPEVLEDISGNHNRESQSGDKYARVVRVEEDRAIPEGMPKLRKRRFSAFVSIMRGCNNFCSYCNVPYVRGREVSRPCKDILREIEELAQKGYKEVTLLGQNVNSYGKESREKVDFADLLGFVDQIEGLRRIRFTTSHPKDLSDKLLEKMAELDKVCEHLHLPVQSGSNKILSRMKRGYTREHYQNLVDKLRQAIPEIALTTDIIVGFPGEEEKDFQDTLELVETVGFDGAFTFCYSPLKGTEAAQLEERIPEETSGQRLRRLIELQQKILLRKNEFLVGKEVEIMVEKISKKSSDELQGRTRTNKMVVFEGRKELIGNIISVKIVASGCWALRGEVSSC